MALPMVRRVPASILSIRVDAWERAFDAIQ